MEKEKFAQTADLRWVGSTKNERGQAMSVIRPLMDVPTAMEVWYEPGFVKEVHQHPMDEFFYLIKGSMMMHGRELTPGSAIFVPGKTLYGPEYASNEGAFFLRVELWDTDEGRPGGQVGQVRPGNGKFTAYEGPVTSEGLPTTGGATTAPPLAERTMDPVAGSFSSLAEEVDWQELSLPGETGSGRMFVKKLLYPNPDVEELWREPGNVIPARTADVDRLWYVIDGEMTMNGHRMTKGSSLFVRKGESYESTGTGPEGVHYLRVMLIDQKGLEAKLG